MDTYFLIYFQSFDANNRYSMRGITVKWIHQRLNPAVPGSIPKHNIYTFSIFNWIVISGTRCWNKSCHDWCLQQPNMLWNIWGTFVAKFIAKNFEKSPNFVSLIVMRRGPK